MPEQQPRYLKKVNIRNFQSHRDTEVNLVPGINLVVGTSDIGKSAFMRALNLVMHNEIPNREFVTYGEKDATVIVEFSDGTIVERVKGATKNAYYATLPDGTRIAKEKLGNSSVIPEEIYKALGSPPIDKRHGPLAYADQHSPLFLVSLSPTELPRCISELTGLDDYETAALDLAKNARRFDRKIKENKERIVATEAELEQYVGLDDEIVSYEEISKMLEAAEAVRVEAEDIEKRLQEYNIILEQGRSIMVDINAAKEVMVIQPDYIDALMLAQEIENILERLEDYDEVREQISELDVDMSLTRQILDSDISTIVETCRSLELEIVKAQGLLEEYNQVITDGNHTKTEIEKARQALDEAISDKESMIEEYTKNGLLCPECKQPISEVA